MKLQIVTIIKDMKTHLQHWKIVYKINIVNTRMTCTYCLYTVYIVSKIIQLTTTELHSVNKIDVKLIK